MALGDAITQGAVSKHLQHSYVNLLADKFNFDLLNRGVGGTVFDDKLLAALPVNPDIITVGFGVNDYGAGRLVSEKATGFFEKLYRLYHDKKIIVLLPIWFEGETEKQNGYTLAEGRNFMKETVRNYPNITVVDCSNFVPHLPEFYWDNPHCHPNDLGFLYYGEHLCSAVAETLQK